MCSSRKNPYPPHGKSLEIPRGRGILKVKILEAKYEAKLEFSGGMGGAKQKTFHGGSMDIFWSCTIAIAGLGRSVITHSSKSINQLIRRRRKTFNMIRIEKRERER